VLAIKKGVGPMALECWEFIGRCYKELGFPREYALATSTGAFNLKAANESKALKMAQNARKALNRIARLTNSAADKQRLNRFKDSFKKVFGGGSDAAYEPAISAMNEGKYERAIEGFGTIEAENEKFELAKGYIVWCTLKKAETDYDTATRARRMPKAKRKAAQDALESGYAATIDLAEKYLAFTKATPIRGEPVKKNNREQARGVVNLAKAAALKGLERWDESLNVLAYFEGAGKEIASRSQLQQAQTLKVQIMLGKKRLDLAEQELEKLEKGFAANAAKSVINLKGILGADYQTLAEKEQKPGGNKTRATRALVKSVEYRRAWVKGINPKIENLYSLARDLYSLNRFDEAKTYLDAIIKGWGEKEKLRGRERTTLRLARLYLARCLVWQGKYLEAEPILRALYEKKKRDKSLLKEYAELLTGTIRTVDRKIVYVPGRGAHRESAMVGYKLWQRIIKQVEGSVDKDAVSEYLEARFHQNLVRWAQNVPDKARQSIKLLKLSLGDQLDRKKGSRKPGYWEKRFSWLEKRLSRKAPQTPPPMPAPRG
jgi:hypothetical protein